jgi:hypothetical protein
LKQNKLTLKIRVAESRHLGQLAAKRAGNGFTNYHAQNLTALGQSAMVQTYNALLDLLRTVRAEEISIWTGIKWRFSLQTMKIKWATKLRRLVRSSSTHDAFHENWRVIEQNLDACSDTILVAKQHDTGIHGLEAILNVSQFLSILTYDLSVVHYELMTLEAGWRRSFHARVAALLIVEFMEDIGQLVGKEWRAAILPFVTGKESQERFRQICKTLAELRRRHESHLRELRNVAIGHRDRDANRQLKAIREMDSELIYEIVLDVTKWMTVMIGFQTDLLNEMAKRIQVKRPRR